MNRKEIELRGTLLRALPALSSLDGRCLLEAVFFLDKPVCYGNKSTANSTGNVGVQHTSLLPL